MNRSMHAAKTTTGRWQVPRPHALPAYPAAASRGSPGRGSSTSAAARAAGPPSATTVCITFRHRNATTHSPLDTPPARVLSSCVATSLAVPQGVSLRVAALRAAMVLRVAAWDVSLRVAAATSWRSSGCATAARSIARGWCFVLQEVGTKKQKSGEEARWCFRLRSWLGRERQHAQTENKANTQPTGERDHSASTEVSARKGR
mmetsp:Transcript_38017/g.117463  ORF Transcript_38017/g.117463 Transcript_38017/m.117463 type:complete len:203 (-) Transcript_38017:124-732(-)